MRALKTILIILAALIGVLLILGLLAEKNFRVERSTVIHAPAATVYANVSTLTAMDQWGPWKEEEPDMVATLSGAPDGQVGAISHWKSSKSEGEQELAELVPNEKVRTKLRFISPWAANNEGTYELVAMGDSTKVTWGIQGENGLFMRMMGVLMNMDGMVGPMFEKGLANLKTLSEKQYAETPKGPAITTADRPALLYVGHRAVVPWSEMKAFYTKHFGEAFAAIGKAGVPLAGAPSGLFFVWNEKEQNADMFAGIPVAVDAKDKLKGLEVFEAPAGKALVIDHVGPYSSTKTSHEDMDAHLKANNLSLNQVVIEEYVTDPGAEPDSTKWHTNVIYLVK